MKKQAKKSNNNDVTAYSKRDNKEFFLNKKTIKQIKTNKKDRLPLDKRALIIARLAKSTKWEDIQKETGVSSATVANISKENNELIKSLKVGLIEKELSREERLITRSYDLYENLLDEAENNPSYKLKLKPSDAINSVKTLFDKHQIEQGKPTNISAYNKEDVEKVKALYIEIGQALKDGNGVKLKALLLEKN